MSALQISELGKTQLPLRKGAILSPHFATSTFQKHNDFKASPAKDRLVEKHLGLSTPGEKNNNARHSYSMLKEKSSRTAP